MMLLVKSQSERGVYRRGPATTRRLDANERLAWKLGVGSERETHEVQWRRRKERSADWSRRVDLGPAERTFDVNGRTAAVATASCPPGSRRWQEKRNIS